MATKVHEKAYEKNDGGCKTMKPNEYEKGISVFDLYGDAIEKFLETANPEQIKKVLEIFTKFSGMVGEFGELCEKLTNNTSLDELLKEISDVEWYLTRLESCFGYSKLEILNACKPERSYDDVSKIIRDTNTWMGKLGERLKKIIRDKEGKFTDRMEGLPEIFCGIEIQLMKMEAKFGRSKEEILEINFSKLKSRWERDKLSGEGDNR